MKNMFLITGFAIILLTLLLFACQKIETQKFIQDQQESQVFDIGSENGSASLRAPECEDGDNVYFCFHVDRFRDANNCAYTPPIQQGTCPYYSPIRLYHRESCDSTTNLFSLGLYEGQDGGGFFVIGNTLHYSVHWNAPTIYSGGIGDAGKPARFSINEQLYSPLACGNALSTFTVFPNEFSTDDGQTWSSTLPDSIDLPNTIGRYLYGCKALYEVELCE